jgi:hypothetical protein
LNPTVSSFGTLRIEEAGMQLKKKRKLKIKVRIKIQDFSGVGDYLIQICFAIYLIRIELKLSLEKIIKIILNKGEKQ